MTRTVSLSVDVEDDMELPRVMEILARHMTGLVLEGINGWLTAWTAEGEVWEDEDVDD